MILARIRHRRLAREIERQLQESERQKERTRLTLREIEQKLAYVESQGQVVGRRKDRPR